MTVKPYAEEGSKKQQVERMFDNISHRYDFLNRFFSLGIDQLWRKRVVRMLMERSPQSVLDVATGTADLAIMESKVIPQVTGVDLSQGMLELGQKKVNAKGLSDRIELIKGDSEALPFADGIFDAVTVSFGVRNFGDLDVGLSEMQRVLKPGGQLIVLEFSKPRKFPLKQLFQLYFKGIMPTVGRLFSGDPAAYKYLPDSVQAFPDGEAFLQRMTTAGFSQSKARTVSGGIATIYRGLK